MTQEEKKKEKAFNFALETAKNKFISEPKPIQQQNDDKKKGK